MATGGVSAVAVHKRAKNNHHEGTYSSCKDSKSLPDLPHEVIVEILSRLPVKSLLRFRCVQKSWRIVISHPQFMKTHLNLSTKSQNETIVLGFRRSDRGSCYFLHSPLSEPYFNAIKIDFLPQSSNGYFEVYGSCNGLICLATVDHIYLWNPLIRESKRLPGFKLSGGSSRFNPIGNFGAYGFYYDYVHDDYKLIFYCNAYANKGKSQAKIYSLRTNSWRRIPAYGSFVLSNPGKCIDGFLHWEAEYSLDFQSSKSIVSFDLEKESFGEIPQPNYADGSWLWSFGVIERSLCLLTDNCENRAEIWMMKQYGVKDSWTKLLTISYIENPGLFANFPLVCGGVKVAKMVYTPLPLSMSTNGEILLEVGQNLVLYNHKDKTFNYFAVPRLDGAGDMHSFSESLISLNAYGRDC